MPTIEEKDREIIDQKLTATDWTLQDFKKLNLGAGPGVAVVEFMTASGAADCVLFGDKKEQAVDENLAANLMESESIVEELGNES